MPEEERQRQLRALEMPKRRKSFLQQEDLLKVGTRTIVFFVCDCVCLCDLVRFLFFF